MEQLVVSNVVHDSLDEFLEAKSVFMNNEDAVGYCRS